MPKTVYSNCTFVDLHNEICRPNYSVVVDNSIIEYVGDATGLSKIFLDDCVNYDLAGKFVLPGFIDSHVHIFEEPDSLLFDDFRIDEDLEIAVKRAVKHLNTMLTAGITAAREMGVIERRNIAVKELTRAGYQMPDLVVCGNPITHTDGHFISRCRIVDTGPQMQKAVEEEINAGADFIKINNTIRVGIPQQTLAIAVNTAEKLGTFVACHSYTYNAMKVAINAGVKTLEHVAEFDSNLLNEMSIKGVIPIPTFVAAFDSIPSINPEAQVEILSQTIPDATLHDFIEWYNWQTQNLPELFKSNIDFAIGTDSGFVPTTFDSLHREMALLCKLGATPWQTLRAATIGSAKALGKEKIMGQINVGMLANMVILNQNPTIDIRNSKTLYGVVLKGKFIKL